MNKSTKNMLQADFKDSSDFIVQEIKLDEHKKLELCYIDNMINKLLVTEGIVEPIISAKFSENKTPDPFA